MVADRISVLQNELPSEVTLVAVSKFQPIERVREAYEAGQRIFGENRPQELEQKRALMPQEVVWHFIGHLQTNKIKSVVGKAALIQSVDRIHLLEAINAYAATLQCIQPILLQVHIATEETKQGFSPDELMDLVTRDFAASYPNVQVCGLMGMASFTDNEAQVRHEFRSLRSLFDSLRGTVFGRESFAHCSMGMSSDYRIALEEGSTMVRLGTAIFPPRPRK